MRGQPLLFLGTVVLLWTAARIVHYLPVSGMPTVSQMEQSGPLSLALPDSAVRLPPNASPAPALGLRAMSGGRGAGAGRMTGALRYPLQPLPPNDRPDAGDFDTAMAHHLIWMESLFHPAGPTGRAGSPLVDGPLLIDPGRGLPQIAGSGATTGPSPAASDKKWSIYGWSLLRQGTRGQSLAPGAQYGGSQAGLIVRYGLHDGVLAPAVYARAATALASDDDRTLAVGMTARPWAAIPVDLAVERRIALSSGQRDRFAAMLVAGASASLGRSQVRVDGFGQAGIVGWSGRQGFFDLQLLATRQIALVDEHSLSLGGGMWAGGQQELDSQGDKNWVHRVDMGPRAALAVPIGGSRMMVAVDWRQRVDGNAQPASGAAITVSTGF